MSEIVQGIDELLEQLSALEMTEQKKIVARAGRAGGMVIRDEAERLAPRGESGRLQDEEIVTVTGQVATEAIVKIGPSRRAFYGRFIELGTAFISPNPFLSEAEEQKRDEAFEAVADTLREHIEDATR